MKYHDELIPNNNKGEKQKKKPKSDQAYSDPSEYERIYGIDHLNLGEPAHNLENEYELILVQRREVQMVDT